jgi:microcystin-dependent protein
MASTYSTSLRVELQTTGENRSTWGTKNNGTVNHLEDGIAGYDSIALSDGNYSLSTANGSDDEARMHMLNFTGTLTAVRTITIPSVSKSYILRNSTTGGYNLTISAGGTTATVTNGNWAHIWTDGTDCYASSPSTYDSANVAITGGSITGITDLAIADGGTAASTASAARSNLGAQAQDDILDDLSGLTQAADKLPYFSGATSMATTDITSFARTLLDDSSASTARSTLAALGTADVLDEDDMSSNSATQPPSQQSVKQFIMDVVYPVGSIFCSVSATNPGTYFGGTWVAYAAGRVLVGVGSNGESTWTEGETQGSETHTLTTGEMPSHTHGAGSYAADTDGSHNHSYYSANEAAGGGTKNTSVGVTNADNTHNTSSGGAHTHPVSGTSASAGSGSAHNNLQPSIGVYIWRRTV